MNESNAHDRDKIKLQQEGTFQFSLGDLEKVSQRKLRSELGLAEDKESISPPGEGKRVWHALLGLCPYLSALSTFLGKPAPPQWPAPTAPCLTVCPATRTCFSLRRGSQKGVGN